MIQKMNKQHHFLIISSHYPPIVGGIPLFVQNISEALSQLNFKVTVLTTNLNNEKYHSVINDNLEIFRLPVFPFISGRLPVLKFNKEYRKIISYIKDSNFDRVLINARFYPISLLGAKLAKKKKVPFIILEHGSHFLTFNNKLLDFCDHIYEHIFTSIEKRMGAIFAGVSSLAANWLKEFGIKTEMVIPNSLDAKQFRNNKSNIDYRKEYKISNECFVVVHHGRLLPDKGTRLVLDTAKKLPDIAFFFAGDGPMSEEVKEAANSLNNVYYLGKLSSPEISALLSQSDAFVLPSRTEGLPTSVLEASSYGIPSIVTPVGGIKEIFKGSSSAVIVAMDKGEVAREVRRLASCKNGGSIYRDEKLIHNIEYNFSWKSTALKLNSLFDEIKKPAIENKKNVFISKNAKEQLIDEKTYSEKIVPLIQKELIDLLEVADELLKKMGLSYWLDAGTLLGAVRHKGFIPWDDDADIGMRLKDWQYLLRNAKKYIPEGYSLLTKENTKNFPLFWATLVKDNTEYISSDQLQAGYSSGVFLDIFPFSKIEKDTIARKKQLRNLRFWQGLSYLKYIKVPQGSKNLLEKIIFFIAHYFVKIFISEKKIQRCFWKAVKTREESNLWANLAYSNWPAVSDEVIFPLQSLSFQSKTFPGPAHPKSYLEIEFGDWEKIPPENERHFHMPLYLDLGDGKNCMKKS